MRCTCMMLIGLIGFFAYSANSAMDPTIRTSVDVPTNESVLFDASAAQATEQSEAKPETREAETIGAGSTRDQVVALWGHPTSIDMSNDRWTFGRTLVMFKNDRVVGMMPLTAKQISNLQETNNSPKAKRAANRCVAARTSTARRVAPTYASRPGAYAPRAQSRGGQHFWEPMYRPFHSSQPLPRGQSHLSSRWMGLSVYQDNYFQRPFSR